MSLQTQYETDNIFAKIISGEFSSVKIFENEKTLAFMDVFPQSRGHCLVIHKNAKAVNLLDISSIELSEVMATVQTVAKAVQSGLDADGIRIVQFNGAPAGQTVFHLHFHIIPVYEREEVKPHGSNGGGPTPSEELEPIADHIRQSLPG